MSSYARPLFLMTLAAIGASPLAAQQRREFLPQWELRGDLSATPVIAAHTGVGLNVRAGHYARLGASYALGLAQGPAGDRDARLSQRVDATARFLLDPFAERRRAWYGGAGLTARRDGEGAWKADLLVVAGVEGSAGGKVVPSIEIGLGGGVRAGVVLRSRRQGPFRSR